MLDRRFIDFISDNYYDEIYDLIKSKLSHNIILNDIDIIFCKLFDKYNTRFYGYITVVGNLSNANYNSDNEFTNNYYVVFEGNFAENTIKLFDMSLEFDEPKYMKGISLDNSFYPYISKEKYNDIAETFIEKYYSEYSTENPIDIKKVVDNIGLKIEHKKLSSNSDIFGKICFADHDEYKKNTIYMDIEAENLFGSGQGSMFFTIVHECVHWFIHRKYFLFQFLFNGNDGNIDCRLKISNNKEIRNIELQADKIASRILMPENDFKTKYFEFCRKYINKSDEAKSMRIVINALVAFYHVSKKAILIRLNDLKYNLVGIYEYIDDRYVEPYIFNDTSYNNNINLSYSISDFEFLKLCMLDEGFRKLIRTNKYTLVDKHVIINDKKFLYNDEFGNTKLNSYARNNIEICCIPFVYEYENINYYHKESISFCRSNNKNKNTISKIYVPDEYYYKNQPSIENFMKDFEFIKDELVNMPGNFGEALKYVMDNRKVTIEKAAELSGLSTRTINRLRNKKEKVSLKSILAIIIGLKLPKTIADDLIKKAGYNNITDRDYLLFYEMIYNLNIVDIDKANELLEGMGKTPLSESEE